jgi:hypothetical protein
MSWQASQMKHLILGGAHVFQFSLHELRATTPEKRDV